MPHRATDTASLFLEMRWHDTRLAHAEPGVKTYALADIWHPELLVANDDGSVKRTVPETAEVIFALNGWRNRGEATELSRDRIDVSAGRITWLCEGFARQWHRGPDADELRGLVLSGAEF